MKSAILSSLVALVFGGALMAAPRQSGYVQGVRTAVYRPGGSGQLPAAVIQLVDDNHHRRDRDDWRRDRDNRYRYRGYRYSYPNYGYNNYPYVYRSSPYYDPYSYPNYNAYPYDGYPGYYGNGVYRGRDRDDYKRWRHEEHERREHERREHDKHHKH